MLRRKTETHTPAPNTLSVVNVVADVIQMSGSGKKVSSSVSLVMDGGPDGPCVVFKGVVGVAAASV